MREPTVRSLLLVDSNADERRLVSTVAQRADWMVVGAADLETATGLLQGPHGREVRAAILSSWDSATGPRLLEALREERPDLPVIVLADEGSVELAVDAMRAGASDYLSKPVAPERLLEALNTHADRRRPGGELAPLSEKLDVELSLEQLVGAAPQFRSALAVAAKAARNRLPVLIVGEPGTGKESFARAIHQASLRARGPLVPLDAKLVSEKSIDSELFGHVAGAFPGAFSEKTGRLCEANEGTLLVKNIARLPAETQNALDRTLATGEVRPVGCNGSSSVDVRLIATSNRPLPADFDTRLKDRVENTVVILPPLRERSSDIPALARHFLARIAEQPGMRPLSIGNDALAVLMRYGWPGNLRQLGSVLFRAAVACEGNSLTADDFPHIAIQSRFTGRKSDARTELSKASSDQALAGAGPVTIFDDDGHIRTLSDIEADLIRLAIGHYRGRMTEVARRLGIGRSTLYRKLGDLGIDTAA
ncbi:sigma-54-dependent transcriptional regulator [Sphingomicrobium aestuariivivum]|uniref:sigma-54-dependent transcriptional regulator n=1 Tax=Sphingomicrobium aestuariivivum TaxID=1582356 RepID=UPI001FD68759|nr:sigma-54 dependent transcriptional regulator [Sphingomicrobium aestuariivivum]MCJ8192005.1 sigma-54 dependent transcriptional regulator [Sphingomicrobium aestuariivivum]